jgi:hypothetical protein
MSALDIANRMWEQWITSGECSTDLQHIQYSDIDTGVYHFYCTATRLAQAVLKRIKMSLDYDLFITLFECLYVSICSKRYSYAGKYSPQGAHRDLIVLSEPIIHNKLSALRFLYSQYNQQGIPFGFNFNWHLDHRTKCVYVPYEVYRTKLKQHLFRVVMEYRFLLSGSGSTHAIKAQGRDDEQNRRDYERYVRGDIHNTL